MLNGSIGQLLSAAWLYITDFTSQSITTGSGRGAVVLILAGEFRKLGIDFKCEKVYSDIGLYDPYLVLETL
jgi:hypothetical protein